MNPNSISTKVIKTGLNYAFAAYAAAQRATGAIDYPIPSFSGMHKTSSKSLKHYNESGIRTATAIYTAARQQGMRFHHKKILDFGCGVGRQLAQFTRELPDNQYFACDIDDLSIDFIAKNYPQVESYVSSFHPPLKYDDGTFDLIYSVSIFSHLKPDDIRPWVDELARITAPGGLLALTTEGHTAIRPLSKLFGTSEEALRSQLKQDGVLYKEYEYLQNSLTSRDTLKSASLMIGIEGSYGNTALSPEHIVAEWESELLEVIGVIEGVIDFRQDLVLLRRKPTPAPSSQLA